VLELTQHLVVPEVVVSMTVQEGLPHMLVQEEMGATVPLASQEGSLPEEEEEEALASLAEQVVQVSWSSTNTSNMNTNQTIAVGVAGVALVAGTVLLTQQEDTQLVEHERPPVHVATETMRLSIMKDGEIINSVVVNAGWTGAAHEWQPPEGTEVVISETVGIGDRYENGSFRKPTPPPEKPDPTIEELKEKDSLTAQEQERLLKYLLLNER
jgi:hypothetical protein